MGFCFISVSHEKVTVQKHQLLVSDDPHHAVCSILVLRCASTSVVADQTLVLIEQFYGLLSLSVVCKSTYALSSRTQHTIDFYLPHCDEVMKRISSF